MIQILSFNVIKDAVTALLFSYFVAYQCESQIREKERIRNPPQLTLRADSAANIENSAGRKGTFQQLLGRINLTYLTISDQEIHTHSTEGKPSLPYQRGSLRIKKPAAVVLDKP